MTVRPLIVRWLALLVPLTTGCYLSHQASDTRDGSVDAGPRPDRALTDGAQSEAGTDAGIADAGDAGEPPIEEPPPPGRCRTTPAIAPFMDPVLEYRWPDGEVVRGDAIHVCSTPLVIDLEPDGETVEPVLVFVSYPPLAGGGEPPGVLRIVDPRTNRTISYPPTESGIPGVLEASTNVAAGDIDGDGRNEIVGIGVSSGTYAFRSDGTLMWSSPYPTALERGGLRNRTIGGAVSLADLEGDGTVEVVVGRTVLEGATGEHRWTGPMGTGQGNNQFLGPISCVADLDGDGVQEIVAGHTAFRPDGSVLWNNTEIYDGFCAVADTDPNPGPEVVLSTNGYVRVLSGLTGAQLWQRRLEGRVRLSIGGAPTIADFDGDGDLEFGIAHGAAYAVYDPSCDGRPAPSGCQADGILWMDRETADDSSSGTGSSVFDFNGDGRAEVVYNDQYFFRVYDGTTGRPIFEHRNSSRTRTENPTIADVDNDGDAEIIFSANAEASFIRREFLTDAGVEIWGDARGRWVGARRIWNQHAYAITNVTETGEIPRSPSPSWSVLNAYRQNLREDGDVLATPDLWGGRGTYECLAAGRARFRIRVQNWGLERVGAGVVVGLHRDVPAGPRIATARTTRTLEPLGDTEELTFDVELEATVHNYYAVLDDPTEPGGGTVDECREDNNAVLVWRPECP